MDAIDPTTGDRIDSYEEDAWVDVDAGLATADAAFEDWRERSIPERERFIERAASVLRDNAEEYARTMTREMGKPIEQARGEVEKCAWVCEHYAESAGAYLADQSHPGPPGADVRTVHDPLGPVLAVMPWNFPFWQVFRFAAPALTAGNVALLTHAPNVPGCALAIEDVFRDAGYPEGVFQTLVAPTDLVHDAIADDRVRAATVTGSTRAGSAVAATAGAEIKRTVLELGGSDPFIVLDDADVAAAAEAGAWARNQNGGQSCIAGKRFLVHTDVYETFREAFVAEVDSLTVGDPTEEATDVGPQARADLLATLHEQVEASVEAGATVLAGGEPLDRDGYFYPPTVLADVPAGCPADSEEVFGPVAALYELPDEDAIRETANDTRYGLGASIWTGDHQRGRRLAGDIEAGCVFVNELVKSDPRVPFGGVKDSGYGRELSEAGIREFVNRKTVWVDHEPDGGS